MVCRRATAFLLAVQFVVSLTSPCTLPWATMPCANAQEVSGAAPSTGSVDLNLTSTDKSVSAASVLQSATQATINLATGTRTVGVNDMLTPAEMVAVRQVVNTGQQYLQLNDLGAAVGGGLRLNYYAANGVSNLVIPENVRASQNAALLQSLNVSGNLTNSGIFNVYSSNAAVSAATVNATNIYNNAGAVIASTLANLNLNAINNIVNAGTIRTSGNLNLTAGNSIVNAGSTAMMAMMQANNISMVANNIVNSGTIAALTGNINIASQMAQNLTVNNIGGLLQALNGKINLRDSSYYGPGNINLTGGDYLSKQLNLYAGTGTAIVSVGQITGHVNTYAGAEHISADTPLLKLGNNISGDPTYYNTGSIEIVGTVSSTEGLAIVAGGDITADLDGQIVTNGNNLLMIAGANITSTCTGCTTPGPGEVGPTSGGLTPTSGLAEGTVTVSLTGGAGGNIDLSGSLAEKVIDTSSTTSSGGNVTLVALADPLGGKGQVKLNSFCLLGNCIGGINTVGGGAGGGGNVTVYAGSSFFGLVTSISTNQIVTTSNGTLNSGSVTLQTTQAVTSDLQPLVLDAHGAITSGNTIEPGATLAQAGISTGTINTDVKGGSQKAGDVIIKAYGDIDTSAGTIATINNGVGAAGEVIITSSNGSVSTGEIDSFVYSGWIAAANVSISAYGNITTNGNFIYAFQGGSGAGGTITLTSTNGSVSTGVLLTGVGDTVAAGNVIISAYGNITTDQIYAFNVGTGGGGTVTFTSSNGAISTGEIAVNTQLGLVPAGSVTLSAYGDITVGGKIDASNAGPSEGGAVTLLTLGSLTTGDINTSTSGSLGGSITAAAAGNNGSYSIEMGNLQTSGSAAAGSVEVVSTDFWEKPVTIGTITTQASGQSGAGGSVGIATRGGLTVENIDTTNTSASASSGAHSGSVFLSSGSTAVNAITAGAINAYNSANGSATGQVILIASGTILSGTITTSAGNSSVSPLYTSFTTSISSSTTIDVSLAGISGLFSNYNPQGYSSISGGGTQLTIDSGGNSSLLAPLLCLGTVSIESINSNSGAQADAVALVAFGNLTLSGAVGVNTVGTASGGNVNLLSITGQISVDGLATNGGGLGSAGNVSVLASGFIDVGGIINASNSGGGAGGTVTLISSTSSVTVGVIDTHVTGGSGPAGSASILAYQGINTNGNAINASNAGTGAGGTVTLISSTNSVLAGQIDTYVSGGTSAAGNVFIAAYADVDTNSNAIAAYNSGSGSSGNVILISSNSTIATGAIDSHVASGSQKAADVTVSSYGDINLTGVLNAANTGSGSGSTINLLSGNGSVTTGGINVNVSTLSTVAGNVNIEASGAIDTSAGTIQAKNGGTRPIDSGVTLLSHTSSVTTGGINISVDAGSAALAGNVSISAPLFVSVGAKIDASNNGTGSGGIVTLVSSGNSVTVSDIDTHVQSSSALAGGVSILAYGLVDGGAGTINTSNAGSGTGGAGTAGTVTLMSSTGSVTTGGITTNVSNGSAPAGDVTILADGNITANGAINTSNAGTGSAGEVALTSGNGSVSISGIQTNVGGGSADAGNVLITAPGAISVTGSIATNHTGAGAGGSVALITEGTISLSTIITSGTPSGSVFLSSGYAGSGAIITGAITLNGGSLLATAATSGSIAVQSFTNGNAITVDAGQIYATGTYTSNVTILPLAFNNSATVTITPAIIPGGGFLSFSNTGTVTLANDPGASGNVITFRDFLPVYVQGAVTSLGTTNDSTGQGNFFVMAPAVSVTSATTYMSATGSLNILANQMSLAAINTNGANLNLTGLEAITAGTINTINAGGTSAGSASLLSVISSVTTGAINTYVTSGTAGSGNVIISAYGTISTNQQAINASNSGTGIGGTVNITISGNGSVETGQISTSINNTLSNAFAGNVTILAASAIKTNGQVINTSNSGGGAGGTLMLTSETFSIITSDIDTHAASGSAPAGNVFISALQLINTGNINSSHAGTGTGGNVTLVRAAAMGTANIDTSSTGSAGGSIIAGAVGDNGVYTLVMGNLKTSGFTNAGSIMLVGDDFGAKPLLVGTITAQATGPSGVGGAVGISGLGTVAVGTIDTTNTYVGSTSSGAQSGSVFLSSGSKNNNAIAAGVINAYNSGNGSASGQVILIASGTITTFGAITTSAGTITAQTFTSNVVSGSGASVNPNYTSNLLSITSSTTVNVSVTGISGPSSNYNPSGYAALSGNDTVLTIDSGGNSSLLAPLVFTAFVPMTIKSINSNSHTAADSIALLVFGNLTLSDPVGINAAGSISGGSVTMQSSAGQISITGISTNSNGAGAAGSINISAWAAIPVTGTINASNTSTGAGGTVFLASTDNSVATGGINTSVAGGSASAGNVTVATYGAMSINAINASNSGTGAGGTVLLTSSNSSVATGEIDTHATSGAAGNVFISAFGSTTLGGDITANNTGAGAGGTVTLSAGGNISTTDNTVTVASPTITLISTTGNIGTTSNALATACTGSMTVDAFGSAYINQTGAFTLLDSHAGGNFQLNSSGSTTINSIASSTGSISVILGNAAGTLSVAAGSSITTDLGNILLENDNVAAGSIVVGANVDIFAHGNSPTAGQIAIVIGPVPTLPNLNAGTKPANVTTVTSITGKIYFGTTPSSSITALAPTNTITATGQPVIFNTGTRPASAISLGGGDRIGNNTGAILLNLDLTNTATVTTLVNGQNSGVYGGTLVTSGGIATGGTLILQTSNLASTMTQINIPANVSVTFDGLQNTTQINVGLQSTIPVTINGTLILDGTNVNSPGAQPSLNITTQQQGTVFSLGSTGSLSFTNAPLGDFLLAGAGPMTIAGGVTGNFTLQTTNRDGSITFSSNVGSPTSNLTLILNGSGSIIQTTGIITAATLTLSSTAASFGTEARALNISAAVLSATTTRGSFNINNIGNLTLNAITANETLSVSNTGILTLSGNLTARTLINLSAGSITNASGATLNSANLTLQSTTGDIGSLANNVNTSAQVINVSTAGGNAFLNSTGVVSLGNIQMPGGTLVVTNNRSFRVPTPTSNIGGLTVLAAPGSDTKINISAPIGNATAGISLNAGGTGEIELSQPVIGASVVLTSGSGRITGSVNATTLTVNTGPEAYVELAHVGTSQVEVGGSGGINFDLKSRGAMLVDNITTSAGPIRLIAETGQLHVSPGSSVTANNGRVTMNAASESSGSVLLDTSSSIVATGAAPEGGKGTVTVFVGNWHPESNEITPANVTPLITAPGKIYYGVPGITAVAPANMFTADTKNIIFNGPAITINGDVDISALKIGCKEELSNEDIVDTGDNEYEVIDDDALVLAPKE